jgi:hypothetical protein
VSYEQGNGGTRYQEYAAVLSDVGISTRSVLPGDLIVIAPIDIGIADSCFNAELVCGGVGEV